MRPKTLSRRRSRARTTQPLPFSRAVPLRVEMLETRVVPSNVTGGILAKNSIGVSQFHADLTFVQPLGPTDTAGRGSVTRSAAQAGHGPGLPILSSLSPSSAQAGSSELTLTVNGTNFVSTSVVQWNGSSLVTTFASSTKLTAVVPADLLAQAGSATVTVHTPGVGTSGGLPFTINQSHGPGLPILSSLSPNSAQAGSSDLTLTVNGTNFVSTSVVQWNGSNLVTTFVSSTQLTAVVPADLLAQQGTATVTVFTPSVGSSQGLPFTITQAPVTGMGMTISATPGVLFSGPVATFTVSNTSVQAGQLTASIDWGFGLTNAGTITDLGGGKFQVSGTVTFPSPGTYPITITVFDLGISLITIKSTANVTSSIATPTLTRLAPPQAVAGGMTDRVLFVFGSNFTTNSVVQFNGISLPTNFLTSTSLTAVIPWGLLALPGTASVTVSTPNVGSSNSLPFTIVGAPLTGTSITFTATKGVAFTGPVALFSTGNNNLPASLFTATINWGNNVTSAGTITPLGGNVFQVSGTNTYAQTGTYPVTVTVLEQGGISTIIHSTANVGSSSRGTAGNGGIHTLGQENIQAVSAAQASTGQEHDSGAITTSPDATSTTPLVLSSASMQAGQITSAELYWQSSPSSGDQVLDPNGWAAQELTLALGGN